MQSLEPIQAKAQNNLWTSSLMDVLEKSKAEVERLIRAVQGFVSFSLVRIASGGFSVSVFQDKAGTDESVRVAREWIAKNAANLGTAPPAISEGTVILHVKYVRHQRF
jgi:hypothetical protein